MQSLKVMYEKLDRKWPCTSVEYPILGRLKNETDALSFKLHHALSHVHKSVGKIEATLEQVDHGADQSSLQNADMLELMGKSLVNVVQVAKTAGIDPEELERWTERFLAS